MGESPNRRDFLRRSTAIVAAGSALLPEILPAVPVPRDYKERGTVIAAEEPQSMMAFIGTGAADELKRFSELPDENPPKWLEWWKTNFLRVDFDMLMTDASPEALSRIDPEFMISTIADAGLQGLWGYVQDPTGWVYYPSKIGRQFPKLQGRDLVGEYVSACRKHGLRFMGYFDPQEMGIEVTHHPEWRHEYPGDKIPTSPRLWGRLCYNRLGSLDFMLSLVKESLTQYAMDAVWFDEFWVEPCGCAYCQKRYKEETGRELPFYFNQPSMTIPNVPDRPEYGFYFYQCQKWVSGWAKAFHHAVKEVRPECVVLFQYGSYGGSPGRFGYTDELAAAADVVTKDCASLGYQYQHSLQFKTLRSCTRNFPYDGELPIGEHHSDEVSPKQVGLLKQQYAYILAHGGAISYIDDMDWSGRISDKKYERMKKINAWAGERFPYLGGVLVADVAVYLSQESNAYPPKEHHFRWNSRRGDAECGTEFSIHRAGNVAFTQAMLRENIPFAVVQRSGLKDLSRYKVVYMSNVEVLRDEEAAALRDFVNAGGGLVVTYRTGMRDEQYQERTNFGLADLMGTDYLETPDVASSFIMVGSEDRTEGFFQDVGKSMPYFEADGPQCYVSPHTDTIRLGKIARPKRPYLEDGFPNPGKPPTMELIDPKEIPQANAGYRYDPEIITDHPSVVLNKFGKGRVAYCAAYPAYDYIDNIHSLILALVDWAAGGKLDVTVRSNAPAPVEIVTMEQINKKRTVIHAINWQPDWPGVAAHAVEVTIKTFGRKARKAYAIEAKADARTAGRADSLNVIFPPIEAWETVVIEWT